MPSSDLGRIAHDRQNVETGGTKPLDNEPRDVLIGERPHYSAARTVSCSK